MSTSLAYPSTFKPLGPKTSTTTTTFSKVMREYNYSTKGGQKEEPFYQNESMFGKDTSKYSSTNQPETNFSSNLTELDNLLENLNSAKNLTNKNNGTVAVSSQYSKTESKECNQINKLISDLEKDLMYPKEDQRKFQDTKLPENLSPYQIRTEYYSEMRMTEIKHPKGVSSPKNIASGPTKPASASVATKELDDLMMSLSEIKIKEKPSEYDRSTDKKKVTDPLDSLLEALESDLKKPGADQRTKSYPDPTQITYGYSGDDQTTKGYPRDDRLKDKEKDAQPIIDQGKNDYSDLLGPQCAACNKPIKDNCVSALNAKWHPECFVCRDCHCPFIGGSFFDWEGLPYCEVHYHARRGYLCAGCHKPIFGRCVTAMFRKFHPEHFVCSFCLKQLNNATFKEQNDKPYCHHCFDKLFG